ncbi:MAG: hypothetical protein AVO38_10905 [delta proteobacterium ML8_D]|jgi:hypothetical protein|nr:MAG: hypothetical protein AVO34_05300 [Firmicutes bacterium ML8_F2]OPL15096.1 MAG: hypothetical protein AVO38_10905 [delta proteobacterium ML8_D]
MERPSFKELYGKIEQAKDAIEKNQIFTIDLEVIAADAIELGYEVSEVNKILSIILKEIDPKNYVGNRPPQKSYKKEIKGFELFAFRWISKTFGCESYLKFSIKQDSFYLVSLHQDRSNKGE